MFPQFLLQDVGGPDETKAPRKRWHEYQTGLFHHDGRVKRDVLQGFRLPFHVEVVRTARVGGRCWPSARCARRPASSGWSYSAWRPEGWLTEASLPAIDVPGKEGCGDFLTDHQGFYARRLLFRGTERYRAVWRRADGKVESTPELTLTVPD